jgi:hypothetical protein
LRAFAATAAASSGSYPSRAKADGSSDGRTAGRALVTAPCLQPPPLQDSSAFDPRPHHEEALGKPVDQRSARSGVLRALRHARAWRRTARQVASEAACDHGVALRSGGRARAGRRPRLAARALHRELRGCEETWIPPAPRRS